MEALYEEWYELHPKHINKELDLGVRREPRIVPEVDGEGCFVRVAKENRIKTKAKREETLERLYQEIISTEHKSNAYESTPSSASIVAEPSAPYGDKKI